MSIEKILFSDLIDLHSVNEVSRQLKIDKKYIYKRENRLYFLNINFNFQENQSLSIGNQINFKKDGRIFNAYIPRNIFEEQNLELYFYCCYFPSYIYDFGKTAKLCYKCSFEGGADTKYYLIKKNCTYKHIINGGGKGIQGGYIEKITLKNHTFENNFYLNNQDILNNRKIKIKELIITNTIFSKNFKLHNCEINNILIKNVDFNKNADFYKSTFIKGIKEDEHTYIAITFQGLNFKKLTLFSDCTFQEKTIFKYVTFENFSHFRRVTFNKGVDLDDTNIKEEMNFFSVKNLDSKASKENTSQETYRIIKHNFEKIGNKIEANKYHALELEKRKVDKKTPPSERLVLGLHWLTSRNGTNWWIPLLLIFLVGIITMIGLNTTITEESFFEIFKHIYILYKYKELWDLHPFLLAFNKFSLGYLYYQFLIAVRKDTRK